MTWRLMSRLAIPLIDRFNVPALVQRLAFAGELVIVMYHGVLRDPLRTPDWCFIDEEQFAAEVSYLERQSRVLPLQEALEQMRRGALDKPTVAITFDDGFQSVHDIAFPILKELSLPSTVFLTTAIIDTAQTIWFCRLIQLLSTTRMEELAWRDGQYDLRGADARAASSARLQSVLKELDPETLQRALYEIQGALDVDSKDIAEVYPPFRVLDRASIARMTGSGLVEFGAHTESHPILTRVDPDRANAEIQRSVERTAELTGAPCRLFAYPNGRKQDYDAAIMARLRHAGVSSALTTIPGSNTRKTPDLELRRYGIGPGSLARFKVDIHLRPYLSRSNE